MTGLRQQLAAHPLAAKKPYNAIKFKRVDGQGTPLYTVAGDKKELGAFEALGTAFEGSGAIVSIARNGWKRSHCPTNARAIIYARKKTAEATISTISSLPAVRAIEPKAGLT